MAFPGLLQDFALLTLHALDHLLARRSASEPIGLRQQRSLARNRFDVARQKIGVEQALNDLLRCQTFRYRDCVLNYLAVDQCVDDVLQARLFGELIFPPP